MKRAFSLAIRFEKKLCRQESDLICEDTPKYCKKNVTECRDETQYRKEPVYKQWCIYDTYAWKELPEHIQTGTDGNPAWPDTSDRKHIRTQKSSAYTVNFSAETQKGSEDWSDEPKTEVDFRRWSIGKTAMLERSNAGRIGFPEAQNTP